MAKTLSLLCAAPPKAPRAYLAALPRVRPLWSGAGWDAATLGALDVTTQPPTPRHRKLYPWQIHTVLRFSGMARPKRDWTALHALAVAVLEDVGGVMAESGVVLARLPSGARASLGSAIEEVLAEPAPRISGALEEAVKWKDPVTDEEIAARLEEALRQRAETAPYEALVQLARGDGPVSRWLAADLGDDTRLGYMLERTDEAGLPLGSLAREHLRKARQRRWRGWAQENPPSRGEVADIVAAAVTGDARALTVLAAWCEHDVTRAERAALAAALTRSSAAGGPWPEAMREAVRPLIWKSEDDPLPARGAALHESDARWVAGELAARAAERERDEALAYGINARNAARLRQM